MNCLAIFSPSLCFLQGPSMKKPLVLGKLHVGLYLLVQDQLMSHNSKHLDSINESILHLSSLTADCNATHSNSSCKVWHNRLGHLPLYKLKQLSLFYSGNLDDVASCEICPQARKHKLPFPNSHRQTSHIFDLIHIDIWGPYHTTTYNGYRHFLTIVVDYSRTTWTHLLSTKSNAFHVIQGFVAMVETQFQTKIKVIRSDNALELGSSKETSVFIQQRHFTSN